MSNPVIPSRPELPALRSGRWYDPGMRIGDAERGEVADRLSQHYSNGRLDYEEFSERLDRAMSARTASDLTGLLADLPDNEPVPVAAGGSRRLQRRMLKLQLEHHRLQLRQQRIEQQRAERRQRAHSLRWLPLLAAVLIAAVIVIHALTHSVIAWVLLGLIAFGWLRHNAAGRDRGKAPDLRE